MIDREQARREAIPRSSAPDSTPAKAPFANQRGCDGSKKIVGRNRHVAFDTDGRLPMVDLTTANVSDSADAPRVLALQLHVFSQVRMSGFSLMGSSPL